MSLWSYADPFPAISHLQSHLVHVFTIAACRRLLNFVVLFPIHSNLCSRHLCFSPSVDLCPAIAHPQIVRSG
ncbi:hypothetical protein M404DRAFT_406226 [Pisolithus tinctorius Marx 270]|uniref:Uncharacterized protein n=1 Tax=Pisolithus tinctorius Marx 270 TaxID=870435 RepID=A0A0C3P2K1_PISTI|nr:hypothetical protein M404DRAFT_406226 [Pisolithus tinctorius Marx 270]